MNSADNTLGLYLSVPFCRAKCSFCNFASDAFPPARMAAYVDRLCQEIAGAALFAREHGVVLPSRVDTVFVGGGTPSLLEPEQMRRIFRTVRDLIAVDADAEITVEAAPGQISDELLQALLDSGVNRISLGVQSFVDRESHAVGRTHTGASCLAEIERLRLAGVANRNVDLIAGLPHQTAASWAESLQHAVNSGLEHVSVYMLEVDEDSRLGRELIGPGVRYGAAATPTESLVADLYTQACETLGAVGLAQYEISNFAREGRASRHNCKYWTRAPYLGAGLDAHSMLRDAQTGRAVRFANGDTLDGYVHSTDAIEPEHIDQLGEWEESIFLGLRLNNGIAINDLAARYPNAWVEELTRAATELSREGLMTVQAGRIALTQRGRIVSSSIFGELLANEPIAV